MSLIVIEVPNGPTCDTCGAPITTGAMALLCPLREKCEFWPAEGIDARFHEAFQSAKEAVSGDTKKS
jgi:hypothetical protein